MSKQFVQWVYETYTDQLNLPNIEGSKKYHKFIESMDIDTILLSGALRVQKYHIIKFGYPMRRAGYITAILSVQFNNTSSYYSYVYWPRESIVPEYICLSPTFNSRDGEYRHRFIWFQDFMNGYEKLISHLDPIEQNILENIAVDALKIDVNIYSDEKSKIDDITDYINSSRLGIKALVAVLMADVQNIIDNTLQNHTSVHYVKMINELFESNKKYFDENWNKSMNNKISVFKNGKINNDTRTQCGQKLIPLTIHESINVNDINFAPWREIWISQSITDLIINGIAPMFPIYNNWSYIDGTDRSLFENKAMHEKYDRSDKAKKVNEKLRQARQLILDDSKKDYILNQTDAHIYDSINYAQKHAVLTNISICSTGEYIGQTLRSLPNLIRRTKFVSPALTNIFENPTFQLRYLFDLCYGVHILHTRNSTIHADLHLNNITHYYHGFQYVEVLEEGGKNIKYREKYTNPTIAYVLSSIGEDDTYVFPHEGTFMGIIDFSRSIIGPKCKQKLIDDFGELFTTKYYRSQVNRALRVLNHYIPNFVQKNQEKIKGLLFSEPEIMFKIMTAVDFLAIGRNIGALLKEIKNDEKQPEFMRMLNIPLEGIESAESIENLALEHLVGNLSNLMNRTSQKDITTAGDFIIPKIFKDFKYSAWAENTDKKELRPYTLNDATLVDAYNAVAPLKYSSTDYAKYPPWARFDELSRHLGDLRIENITAGRTERPFLESLELDSYFSILHEKLNKQIKDAPAAETSSWIT